MSNRNDYWGYLQLSSRDMMHYGVKGMKWGVRHDYVPTGQYRYIHRNRGATRGTGSRTTSQRASQNSGKYSTPQQRKIMNRIKIAKGAAIVAGTAMAVYGGYKWSKLLKSPTGQRMIANGKRQLNNKVQTFIYQQRNARNYRRAMIRNAKNIVRQNPVGRTISKATSVPRRVIGGSRAGRAVLKVYGAAATISDINSTQQWVRKVKANGKVTKKDVGDLAKDLINPLPDNIPYVNKRAREERRRKKG